MEGISLKVLQNILHYGDASLCVNITAKDFIENYTFYKAYVIIATNILLQKSNIIMTL